MQCKMKLPLLAVQPDKNVFTLDRTLDPKGSRLRLIDDKSQGTRQARKPRTARPPRPGLAAASLRRRDYRPYPQRHQQSAPIPYKEARDFALPTAPPPISKPSGSAEQNNIGAVATFAFVGPSRIRIGSSQEAGMIALSSVRLSVIPTNLGSSWSRNSEPTRSPADMGKSGRGIAATNRRNLPALERLVARQVGDDIEKGYLEIGEPRASPGVALSEFCWAIAVIKAHLSGNSCSGRASSGAPLKFTARWNGCAFSTDFLIALCALRRKARL